jgi:uncharacterized membrane protein YfcA
VETATVFLLVGVGCGTGLLAGFFGVGGGIILVPVLLWFSTSALHVPGHVAVHLSLGTSLLIVAVTSVSAAVRHYRNGHVVPKAALVIGVTSIVAAFIGAQAASMVPGQILLRIFAAILVFTAVMLVIDGKKANAESTPVLSFGPLILTGGVTGILSAMTGLGGGVLSIPMMVSLMRFPMKKAVGTSSATIVLTAAAAAAGYVVGGLDDPDLLPFRSFTVGYVDFFHSLPIIAGTLPMASLGAHVAHKTKTTHLRKLFALFLLVVAIRMFLH